MANKESHRRRAARASKMVARMYPPNTAHRKPEPGNDCPHCVQQMQIARDVAAQFGPAPAHDDPRSLYGVDLYLGGGDAA